MERPNTDLTARARLTALSEKKAPKKAAQIRALWPEIKAALDNGHTHESVCECLAADGITLTARSLASYISRIRRASIKDWQRVRPIQAKPAAPDAPKRKSTVQRSESNAQSTNPLANVQERQRKRSGFDYRPELADPRDLI